MKKAISEATQKHEKTVDDGLAGYVEIGTALKTIRDKNLHEGTFAEYVEERFDIKRHAAYRTIRAAEVALRLREGELMAPKNEGQAHLLHELVAPEEQVDVWRELLAAYRPTMKTITEFVRDRHQPELGIFEDSEAAGTLDLESAHHVQPIEIRPSDADPIPSLERALQYLRTAANGVKTNFDNSILLLEHLDEAEALITVIREATAEGRIAA